MNRIPNARFPARLNHKSYTPARPPGAPRFQRHQFLTRSRVPGSCTLKSNYEQPLPPTRYLLPLGTIISVILSLSRGTYHPRDHRSPISIATLTTHRNFSKPSLRILRNIPNIFTFPWKFQFIEYSRVTRVIRQVERTSSHSQTIPRLSPSRKTQRPIV